MIRFIFRFLRWAIGIALVVWGVIFAIEWIGPTVPMDLKPDFDATQIGDDLDAWLAESEATVPNIRAGSEKRIVWAGAPGTQTDLAVVNLHGFSASSEEIRPLPEEFAAGLGANLYHARMPGHGRDSAAIGEPQVHDYINATAEAVAIGRRLGKRVIILGTSTGGSLAVLAALDPTMSSDVAGIALLSPNFRVAGFNGRIIEWPFASLWGPLFVGKEIGFEPANDDHASHWTTRYPTSSAAVLGGLTRATRDADLSAAKVPALFLVSTEDKVVDAAASRRAAARWAAPSELVPVVMNESDDPMGHVLAGDILSPDKTSYVLERLLAWARTL